MDDVCPICLGEIRPRTTTSCGHVFCESCIGIALQRDSQRSCPMCRARVTSFAVHDASGSRTWRVVQTTDREHVIRARGYRQDRTQLAVYGFCFIAMMTMVWLLGDTKCQSSMPAHMHSCMVGGATCYFESTAVMAGISCNEDQAVP